MNGHRLTRILTATLLAALLMIAEHEAFAASAQLTLSPAQSLAIRAFVTTVLEKTVQARVAIHKNDLTLAGQSLSEARPLLELALAYRPTAEVKALLHYVQAQMSIEDNKQTLPELLPLYTALNSMAPSSAIKEAMTRLKVPPSEKFELFVPDSDFSTSSIHNIHGRIHFTNLITSLILLSEL